MPLDTSSQYQEHKPDYDFPLGMNLLRRFVWSKTIHKYLKDIRFTFILFQVELDLLCSLFANIQNEKTGMNEYLNFLCFTCDQRCILALQNRNQKF